VLSVERFGMKDWLSGLLALSGRGHLKSAIGGDYKIKAHASTVTWAGVNL
jgi:hypothetical protein